MHIEDRYDVTGVLGEGAFGRTFSARDLRSGGAVVVKQIAVRGLPGWKPVEAFQREVAVLRTLDHPGVPRFLDAFEGEVEGNRSLLLVTERIEGETLLERIQRGHRWSEAAARELLGRLLETLDYLHGLSPPVIHRDIKPDNVVIRPDGRPVLVDFGAVHHWGARAGGGSLTVVGTIGYMAPEQATGAPVPASDLFALGATLVHALSHCHPADLPRRGLELAFDDRLGCSPGLLGILRRLVEADLHRRYARAAAVQADLGRLDRGGAADAAAEALVRPEPHLPSRLPDAALRARYTFRSHKSLAAWGGAMGLGAGMLMGLPGDARGLLLLGLSAVIGLTGALSFGNVSPPDRRRNE